MLILCSPNQQSDPPTVPTPSPPNFSAELVEDGHELDVVSAPAGQRGRFEDGLAPAEGEVALMAGGFDGEANGSHDARRIAAGMRIVRVAWIRELELRSSRR